MTATKPTELHASAHTLSPGYLHDLRTPLNQILGYSEMLTEQAQEEGQEGFVPDLQKINSAGRQLLTLLSTGIPASKVAGKRARAVRSATVRSTSQPRATGTNSPSATGADPGALILVVDDKKMNRDLLGRRLERHGYGVVKAANGREAMEALRWQPFDLVLLDIMMPELDGYQVLQQIKADETLKHISVIMISSLDELDSVVRCIEMGADDYLPKPFDPTLLKARIGACLEKKAATDREKLLFTQLQENYKRLQDLEKLRDDLMHMIVHDLRTPLTSVITGMQSLEMGGDLDDFQREMVDISITGGETLLGMINDLLDVEKMESGSMHLDYSAQSASRLVAEAAAQIGALCESKNLTIVKHIAANLPEFQGDEDKLKRVIVNLLGNAIKFTPAGGNISVNVHLDEESRQLVFAVSDTGEGIPAEAFERIFEKFGQVEARQAGRKMSTGLGLTFCKLAVETHGGTISVESTPGLGSTFSFTVPLTVENSPTRLKSAA